MREKKNFWTKNLSVNTWRSGPDIYPHICVLTLYFAQHFFTVLKLTNYFKTRKVGANWLGESCESLLSCKKTYLLSLLPKRPALPRHIKARTTDVQRGNSLHCPAENSLPLPNKLPVCLFGTCMLISNIFF